MSIMLVACVMVGLETMHLQTKKGSELLPPCSNLEIHNVWNVKSPNCSHSKANQENV